MKKTYTDSVLEIPVSRIEPDPDQPRKEFDAEYIGQLARSIKSEGLLQPITVRAHPDDPERFLIVTGECRWRAHQKAELATVRCMISESYADGKKRRRIQVIENFTRKSMKLREEANALKDMIDEGDQVADVAESLGMTVKRANNLIQLTGLSDEAWKVIESGAVTRSFAENMMGRELTIGEKEQFIMHASKHGMSSALAAIASLEFERKQNDFAFVLENQAAELVAVKDEMVFQLVGLLSMVEKRLEKLDSKQKILLATGLAETASNAMPRGSDMRSAAMFLWRIANQASIKASERQG